MVLEKISPNIDLEKDEKIIEKYERKQTVDKVLSKFGKVKKDKHIDILRNILK